MKKKSALTLLVLSTGIISLLFSNCHFQGRYYCGAYSGWSYGSSKQHGIGTVSSPPFYSAEQKLSDLDNGRERDKNSMSFSDPLINEIANRDIPDVASEYERYHSFAENEWIKSGTENKSTFGIDVDNASYTNFRRFVNNGQLPPKDAIRLEEWLNFFNYDLEAPSSTDKDPLKITTEVAACPWDENDDLVMIKLQGQLPVEKDLPPSNLVFLVDVSGSMNAENKLPLVQTSMHKLVDKLRPQDRMSIVAYAGYSKVVLNPTTGDEKDKIREAIDGLTSGGGTGGSDGIKTAYKLAADHYDPSGNNRVILATDGDWNIGITEDDKLKELIEEKRKEGIFLSVLGFGMYNLNDQMMEMLADNGNGNYCYVDNEREADRIFNTEFAGSMYVIAKDVKLQVEFDSTIVSEYRLIGYENRVLENWQFEVDSIDAGDLGMGQNVIAFYQVKRRNKSVESIGKIDFRYKPVKSETSILLSEPVGVRSNEQSINFRFASCVIEFALCLRESEFRGNAQMGRAILRGKQNLGDPTNKLSYDKRVEFVGLMEKTAEMWGGYVVEKAPEKTEDYLPQLKLYPNPATAYCTLEMPKELSEEWSIQIFDMSGTLILVKHFRESRQEQIALDGFKAGTYIIKVYQGGFNYGYLRLVVQ